VAGAASSIERFKNGALAHTFIVLHFRVLHCVLLFYLALAVARGQLVADASIGSTLAIRHTSFLARYPQSATVKREVASVKKRWRRMNRGAEAIPDT
jgi:hypothetical protein